MKDYDLVISDEEIAYLQELNCEQMIEDMVDVVNLLESLDIEDDEIIFY